MSDSLSTYAQYLQDRLNELEASGASEDDINKARIAAATAVQALINFGLDQQAKKAKAAADAVKDLADAEKKRLDDAKAKVTNAKDQFEAGNMTAEEMNQALNDYASFLQDRVNELDAAGASEDVINQARLEAAQAVQAVIKFNLDEEAKAAKAAEDKIKALAKAEQDRLNELAAAQNNTGTLFSGGFATEQEYRDAIQRNLDYNREILNNSSATAEARANALNVVLDAEKKLAELNNSWAVKLIEQVRNIGDFINSAVSAAAELATAIGGDAAKATIDTVQKGISKIVSLAGDVARIIANPADIGAWISAITTVVSTVADAINGFKKAYEDAKKLKDDFNGQFSLIDGSSLQEVTVKSRGWFADIFAGPEVIQKINEAATAFAKTLETGVKSALSNSIKAFLTVSDEELKKLNISATEFAINSLRTGIKEAILNAVVEAIIQSAVIKGALGGLLTELSLALGSGDMALAASIIQKIGAAVPGIMQSLAPIMQGFRETFMKAFPSDATVDVNANVNPNNIPTIGFSDAIMLPDAQLLVIMKPIADKFDMVAAAIDSQVPALNRLTDVISNLAANGFVHKFSIDVNPNGANVSEIESAIRYSNTNI